MARRHEHEDHVNHEAWAIPYGDLITLLLAFFVVMYAVSSVNEGKYRVLSDSMTAAFRGSPKTTAPIEIGDKVVKVRRDDTVAGLSPSQAMKLPGHVSGDDKSLVEQFNKMGRDIDSEADGADGPGLRHVADEVEKAMAALIGEDLVTVTRKPLWVEVEIKTDILFPSGSASIQPEAVPILDSIAAILKPLASPIRVEGHTDNRPIRTLQFPSNWELSGARASCIVRLFEERGIAPERMSVAGQGEYQPVADNATAEGRNRNRRVTLVILDAAGGNSRQPATPAPATAPATTAATQEAAP
ncbi:MAG: flagellar motor protein MotB [Gammaproteobacteria bacterium]|nr:MAG: flagellar motor protein MotD [Pseudomonadota bacterium]MBC6944191.1 flagellar motor protein MotD [Gammaproteobacteria bacterium]MCE7895650.1 flagellar motor protein MotD [Gammaproteobacteria bacterium PRO8]MDL1879552.1 flagellar motor protein MotD [Gammaproteobacteria bacterium PRO2]MCL4777523.1 flagellar motor protein MotD [Gammaproteobacteria bacterium]